MRFNGDLNSPISSWADDSDSIPTGGTMTTYTTNTTFAQARAFFAVERN